MKKLSVLIVLILLCLSFDQLLKNNLFTVKPIFVFESLVPEFFSAEGICLFPFIFIKRDIDTYNSWNHFEEIVIHEMTHFHQVLENGFFGFYLKYLSYWGYYILKEGYEKGYYFIPYEIEAYKLAKLEPTLYQKKIINKLLKK